MDKIREKSKFNIEAAELLLKESLYAPSVHCSYYSCFQLMKFAVKDFFGVSYNDLSAKIQNSNFATHEYIINYIVEELNKFVGIVESRNFKRKIKDLKHYRNESDYENMEVGADKGEKAFYKAIEIRNYLNAKFNL